MLPMYLPQSSRKQVYGITFEQGRNELDINENLLSNIVTENKEIPEAAMIDMKIALITLKYTQSNSVCYVKGGQAIGIGAGQQSRIHCTRLAGQKADNWFLRQSPQVLGLAVCRRDLAEQTEIMPSMFTSAMNTWMYWQTAHGRRFSAKSRLSLPERKREHGWIRCRMLPWAPMHSSPSRDNIERAHKSGVKYIAQPGGCCQG